jgi:predicted DNA-binding ribbon-helix-helix protein
MTASMLTLVLRPATKSVRFTFSRLNHKIRSLLGEQRTYFWMQRERTRDQDQAPLKVPNEFTAGCTSIAQFWDGLREAAKKRECFLWQLVTSIDAERREPSLSSAIRVFVLDYYRDQVLARNRQTWSGMALPSDNEGPGRLRPRALGLSSSRGCSSEAARLYTAMRSNERYISRSRVGPYSHADGVCRLSAEI